MNKTDGHAYSKWMASHGLGNRRVYVAFGSLRDEQFFKVGITNQTGVRRSALQVGCPFELRLVQGLLSDRVAVPAAGVEQQIHFILRRYGLHLRGEWFKDDLGLHAVLDRFEADADVWFPAWLRRGVVTRDYANEILEQLQWPVDVR